MSIEALHHYDFDNDPEYQEGMSSIISQVPAGLSNEDKDAMLLDAKCFYFSRKHNINPPLTSDHYNQYLSQPQSTALPLTSTSTPPTTSALPPSLPPSIPATDDDPPTTSISTPPPPPPTTAPKPSSPTTNPAPIPSYPPTFSDLVDLITQNKPIPGIEEIPDTVIPDASLTEAAEGPSPSSRRKKPWENDTADTDIVVDTDTRTEIATAAGGGGEGEIVDVKQNA